MLDQVALQMTKKHLVISAVNLIEGGTLEILRQCLRTAVQLKDWRITAIVHNPNQIGIEGINYIARPKIKPSWIKRVYFEYFECRVLCKSLKPDFWLSMHDMTPTLGYRAGKVQQAVYCHNAMCFYQMTWREIWLDPKLILFSTLYSIFYRINLHKNKAVVVQQDWIRRAFINDFHCQNVVVAHPTQESQNKTAKTRSGNRFFYPSFARVFKNFEVVLLAWEILCSDPNWDGELTLTIDASVNRYGCKLVKRFGHLRNVNFIGRVQRDIVQEQYTKNDCLIFASRLETWGLPITEAKEAGLFIVAADMPYAHEAIGDYEGAVFFKVDHAEQLASHLRRFRLGQLTDVTTHTNKIAPPFAENWRSLFEIILCPSKDLSSTTPAKTMNVD